MLRTLKAEIYRQKIDLSSIADKLGIKPDTLRRKLSENISISLNEMRIIKTTFFPNFSLDYLFQKED